MGSSQGSTMSTNVVGIADGSSAQKEVPYIDSLPVYVKELIAGGAAGGFAKTAVAPLERTKILLQVSLSSDEDYFTLLIYKYSTFYDCHSQD